MSGTTHSKSLTPTQKDLFSTQDLKPTHIPSQSHINHFNFFLNRDLKEPGITNPQRKLNQKSFRKSIDWSSLNFVTIEILKLKTNQYGETF